MPMLVTLMAWQYTMEESYLLSDTYRNTFKWSNSLEITLFITGIYNLVFSILDRPLYTIQASCHVNW